MMSDREFEKMLKLEAEEKKRKKAVAKRERQSKKVRGKRGYWQDEDEKDAVEVWSH